MYCDMRLNYGVLHIYYARPILNRAIESLNLWAMLTWILRLKGCPSPNPSQGADGALPAGDEGP
jgi:hypothetical protein